MDAQSQISINSKKISTPDLTFDIQTDFESETFSFIKSWLSGDQTFTLKTSGSTGTPKEITLSREQLVASAKRTIDKLHLSQKDTALVCLDTKYIAGKMMLVRALEANMNIVAIEPVADPLQKLSNEIPPTFTALVPLQLDEIFRHEDSVKKLNQFKSVIIGGAAVSASLLDKIKKLSCDVYATYGMTETVSHIALQKLNGAHAQDYFETLPGITVKTDNRGCLVIKLPDFQEPVVTNDIALLISDSSFNILGRYDNIINSGGVKLNPETIEAKIEVILLRLGIHASFFVTSLPDERLGQKLAMVIEGDLICSSNKLLNEFRQQLPTYEVPRLIFNPSNFVHTDTGKINRLKTLELLF